MRKSILIFEDEKEDFERICEMLSDYKLGKYSSKVFKVSEIATFNPDLAIIDSMFGKDKLGGMEIAMQLNKIIPGIPIIICTKLCNPEMEDKDWVRHAYLDADANILSVIPKKPWPKKEVFINFIKGNS